MPLEDFFVLPTPSNPFRENVLESKEIVVEVHIPTPKANTKSRYIKIRERSTSDFALASVAAVFEMDGVICRKADIVLGGVAPAPWRSEEAEDELSGKRITEVVAKQAGKAAVKKAEPMNDNGYKVTLAQNIISRAVMTATEASPPTTCEP